VRGGDGPRGKGSDCRRSVSRQRHGRRRLIPISSRRMYSLEMTGLQTEEIRVY
jgi:hypothetical protein